MFFSVCSPTSLRSLGRYSPNFVERLRAAPDISSRGSFFKGQGHRGQRSNFCISAVLGPICMKLGECIRVDPPSKVLGPIFTKLGGKVAPDISLRGSFFERSRSSRSKVKFMLFFSVCSLLLPHRSFFERSRSSRSKVKFMFFSVCSPTSPRSLDRSSLNLVGRLRAAPDISSRGSFFKGQGHRGQRSNFCISAVLGPICMKLGECIQVDP